MADKGAREPPTKYPLDGDGAHEGFALEKVRQRLVSDWRWGRMVWAGTPMASGLRRWERVLRSERTRRYKLVSLVSSIPLLGYLLGAPVGLATETDRSLDAREARAADVDGTRIARAARRLSRNTDDALPLVSNPDRPNNFPRIGPLLDREIDAAIELLRAVPSEELQSRGWHLQPNHFATPLNDLRFLRAHPELWIRSAVPAEIDWDVEGQLALLHALQPYVAELGDVPDAPDGPGRFHWSNPNFPPGDASVYYGMVRHLAPRRVVEIGAGWSTRMLERAVAVNGGQCDVTVIEPFRDEDVLHDVPGAWRMHEQPVQLEPLSTFEALRPRDIVFYDGSHCVRTASDVNWVFFEVLPRLAPGVWIHIHDLMWPEDYPTHWVLDTGLSWNEQYLVQAFLMGNAFYRVRLGVKMLSVLRREEVKALYPDGFQGGSVWLEKVGRPEKAALSSTQPGSRPV